MGQQTDSKDKRAKRATDDGAKDARASVILLCAAKIVTEGGVDGLKMADLARRCGLAKGTVYLYFPTKDELLDALLRRELDDWHQKVTTKLTPETNVADFGSLLADLTMQSPVLVSLCGWTADYSWKSAAANKAHEAPIQVAGTQLGMHLATLLGMGSRPGRRIGFGIMATMLGAQCLSAGDPAEFGRIFTPAVNQMVRGVHGA